MFTKRPVKTVCAIIPQLSVNMFVQVKIVTRHFFQAENAVNDCVNIDKTLLSAEMELSFLSV